jgi:hypothetical protein
MFGDPKKIKAETQKSECENMRDNTYKCGVVWKDGKRRAFPLIIFIKVDNKWKLAM